VGPPHWNAGLTRDAGPTRDPGPTRDDLIASFRVGSQGGGRRLFVVGRAAEAADGDAAARAEPLELAALLLEPAGEAGAELCSRLRRDGFAQLRLPVDGSSLLLRTEAVAHRWFAQPEAAKLSSTGAYGPASGTLAGYANGRDREQLEVRLTVRRGELYPRLCGVGSASASRGESAALAPLLTQSMRLLDGWARGLLVPIAADLGVAVSFLHALFDPPLIGPSPADEVLAPTSSSDGAAAAEEEKARLDPDRAHRECPPLRHAGLRACRYSSEAPGSSTLPDGRRVLCAEHNDVGLLTLDVVASVAGLQAFRQSDRRWFSLEEDFEEEADGLAAGRVTARPAEEACLAGSATATVAAIEATETALVAEPEVAELTSLQSALSATGSVESEHGEAPEHRERGRLLTVMVGDTLAALSGGAYTSCRHRVLAPVPVAGAGAAERVGLPFLFRCRGDAVIDTRDELRRAAAEGRSVTLAEMQPSAIDDLPTADCPQALANYMAWRRKYCK